jgi:nitrate/nitrite-specific signal transduction histidine kinase
VHQSLGPLAGRAAQAATDKHALLVNSAIALAIVAALALILGWYMAGRMLRPVRTITATARRISASNLHQRWHSLVLTTSSKNSATPSTIS